MQGYGVDQPTGESNEAMTSRLHESGEASLLKLRHLYGKAAPAVDNRLRD